MAATGFIYEFAKIMIQQDKNKTYVTAAGATATTTTITNDDNDNDDNNNNKIKYNIPQYRNTSYAEQEIWHYTCSQRRTRNFQTPIWSLKGFPLSPDPALGLFPISPDLSVSSPHKLVPVGQSPWPNPSPTPI
jgi:hypothetical protein